MSSLKEKSVQVYVISLERCFLKRQRVTEQLDKLLAKENRTPIYHVGAVDGSEKYALEENNDIVPSSLWMNPYTRLQMTRGEYGCAASHIRAWEKISKLSEEAFGLVVEDDALFDESSFSIENIETVLKKTGVDFLYLSRKNMAPSTVEEVLYDGEGDGNRKVVKPSYSYWTCCYAVTPKGARTLLCSKGDSYLYKKNLFPVDEFIPYMYGAHFSSKPLIDKILVPPSPNASSSLVQPVFQFKTFLLSANGDDVVDETENDNNVFYSYHGTLKAGAFNNLPVRPMPGTFQSSSTYFSDHIPLKYFSDFGKMYDTVLTTVATDKNHDGLKQLQSTARCYGFEPIVLGLGNEWRGGEMQSGMGGAHKIYYLDDFFKTKGVQNLLNSPVSRNTLFIFCDGYDVIVNENANILKEKFFNRFPKIDTSTGVGEVIFAAESSCWPRKDLAEKYPPLPHENKDSDVKFLNSGIFMGRVKDVARLVAKARSMCSKEANDDQEIFTHLFLEGSNGIVLDFEGEFGFCLQGSPIKASIDNVDLQENALVVPSPASKEGRHKVRPVFIHGNGPYITKTILNSIANYCGGGRYGCWNPTYSSRPEKLIADNSSLPTVAFVYDLYGGSTSFKPSIKMPGPKELNERVDSLVKSMCLEGRGEEEGGCGGYPREKVISFIVYDPICVKPSELYSTDLLRDYFWIQCEHGFEDEPKRYKFISKALREATGDAARFDYVLYMTHRGENFAKSDNSLRRVASAAKVAGARVIAPLLKPSGSSIDSNFWGELNHNSLFYKRSSDYLEIAEGRRTGLFNVPYAWNLLFVEKDLFTNEILFTRDYSSNRGVDMAWCKNVTHFGGSFIKVLSPSFGSIGPYYEPENINDLQNQVAPTVSPGIVTLYDFKEGSREKWIDAYINPDFMKTQRLGNELIPHVHLTAAFTKRFCDEMIAAALAHPDKWSDRGADKHFDERIGGVEMHPTNDIHLKDFGLEEMWNYVTHEIVGQAVWNEYRYSTKGINLAFVVRYKPNKQASLRPHHDSSTYTTNICLNSDFEGGGCRFIRSGATVCLKTPGLMLLHPGKFTHMHEGLQVSGGERYILVTFIN